MAGKWDWLKDEMKGFKGLKNLPVVFKFIKGRMKGPDDITKCTLCPNMCRHACPVGIVDGRETTSPSGKSRIGYLIDNEVLKLDLESIYPVYMCLSCGCCEKYCPFDFSVSDILHPLKEKAVENNVVFDEFKDILENLKQYGYVYGEAKKSKLSDTKENKDRGKILYIRGCTFREKYPDVPEKTIKILRNAGYNVSVLEDEKCCGIPAYNIGDISVFNNLAKQNVDMINKQDFDYIVTSCPSCAYAFRVLYPKQGLNFDAEVLHIVEFLKEKNKDFNFLSNKEISVTYHEPCKLVNGLDKPNVMKEILKDIEGIKIKTPRRHADTIFCCGYGGSTICRLNPELSDEIAQERLSELSSISKNIVTSCPTCKEAFENNKKNDVNIWDIAEFIDKIQK